LLRSSPPKQTWYCWIWSLNQAFKPLADRPRFFAAAYGNEVVRAVTRASEDFYRSPSPEFTEVALLRPRDTLYVDSGAQRYKAAVVVNAAGAWADHVAGLAGLVGLGITPLRWLGYAVISSRTQHWIAVALR